jgi:prepilin-type N-terminal cleavage/methylation domain-containing protein
MKMHQKNRKSRGFTLIEVLIVVGIIAALATALVMAVGNTGPKGRAVTDLSSLRSLQSSCDRFVAEYGSVPSGAFTATGATMTAADRATLVDILTGVYAYSGSDTTLLALVTWCANNPIMHASEADTIMAGHFTAIIQTTPVPRVVVLQYRTRTSDNIVNGNQTLSTAFIANGKTLTGNVFDTTVNTDWAATSPSVWPY